MSCIRCGGEFFMLVYRDRHCIYCGWVKYGRRYDHTPRVTRRWRDYLAAGGQVNRQAYPGRPRSVAA